MIASVNRVALGIHKQQRFTRRTAQLSDKILCSHNWNLVFLRSQATSGQGAADCATVERDLRARSKSTLSVEAAVSAAILHARDTRAATGDAQRNDPSVKGKVWRICRLLSVLLGTRYCQGDQPDCDMKLSSETNTLLNALRKSAKPKPVSAIEKLIKDGPDRDLRRINALAFAAR